MNITTSVVRATTLPLLALRGMVVFPGTTIHLDIGRKKSVLALNTAAGGEQLIFLTAQKDAAVEDPTMDDLYEIGTVARITSVFRMPGDNLRVLVEGLYRARIESVRVVDPHFSVFVREMTARNTFVDVQGEAVMRMCRDLFSEYAELSGGYSADLMQDVMTEADLSKMADKMAAAMGIDIERKQALLEMWVPAKRLNRLMVELNREVNILGIEKTIAERVQEQMDENQRDYYLREQIRAISKELDEEDNPLEEAEEYRAKIRALPLADKSREHLLKECSKLAKMPSGSHEATVVRGYLDACLELPWDTATVDSLDLAHAKEVLDRDHYGLDKVKERILELLAVRALSPNTKGQIVCLAGPPGVGKTSIARSVAEAMGRKYVRVSLGGIRDEAEIRGHRKTYIGSMPGRIMYAVKQAGTKNPLILLDEIDKMSHDLQGDPASAMLEVLDPEQNAAFCDHYLEIPFDLSQVLFITTANDVAAIPAPLLDRMEIIELGSYTAEEKKIIAKKHLIKKQLAENGLSATRLRFTDKAIDCMIEGYTREAGVRGLERTIAKICRQAAKRIVAGEAKRITVTDPVPYLGPKKYKPEWLAGKDEIGVVTGLAWTAVGGTTLPIEVAVMEGTGKIELTGSLGDVMKESARIAVSYVRSRAAEWQIAPDFYKTKDIHIHAPEGAVPKDGPSAGVTMVTALLSALTGIPVRRDVAMTGEISLTGRVLPIGGLKEKTMAAYTCGVKTVVIPAENEPDLAEIDTAVREGLQFVTASHYDTVMQTALTRLPAAREKKQKMTFRTMPNANPPKPLL